MKTKGDADDFTPAGCLFLLGTLEGAYACLASGDSMKILLVLAVISFVASGVVHITESLKSRAE